MPASIQPEILAVSSTVRFNIDALLDLFDRDMEAKPYTSAIKAMLGEEMPFALLEHYFRESQRLTVNRLPGKPSAGGPAGHRLDGWITTQQGDANAVCYQVEVKFWSIHGVQSGALAQRPDQSESDYRRELWLTYWRNEKFREISLDKVREEMQPPEGWIGERPLPLACLWSPVHPTGLADPFFKVEGKGQTSEAPPQSVWVFSASSYLRELQAREPSRRCIELDLPELQRRQELLGGLFSQTAA